MLQMWSTGRSQRFTAQFFASLARHAGNAEIQTNQHLIRTDGPCAVGPKDVFCLAHGARSSWAEPLHLEGGQIGGIGSWWRDVNIS